MALGEVLRYSRETVEQLWSPTDPAPLRMFQELCGLGASPVTPPINLQAEQNLRTWLINEGFHEPPLPLLGHLFMHSVNWKSLSSAYRAQR